MFNELHYASNLCANINSFYNQNSHCVDLLYVALPAYITLLSVRYCVALHSYNDLTEICEQREDRKTLKPIFSLFDYSFFKKRKISELVVGRQLMKWCI